MRPDIDLNSLSHDEHLVESGVLTYEPELGTGAVWRVDFEEEQASVTLRVHHTGAIVMTGLFKIRKYFNYRIFVIRCTFVRARAPRRRARPAHAHAVPRRRTTPHARSHHTPEPARHAHENRLVPYLPEDLFFRI